MARKKQQNMILYLAGAAVVLYYMFRKKPGTRQQKAPMPKEALMIDAMQKAQTLAERITFVPDTETDRQRYEQSQKFCK